jgi:hypothetical protein
VSDSGQQQGRRGVAYQDVGSDYLDKRQLRSGAAGWVLLAGLGVAYVISGDFAGWNFGLAEGGWGGLLIATILMATMYTCLVFVLAELSSTIPTAGGGYSFARRAMGPLAGFMTGTAILIEYAIAPAAIVVFIGGYIESLDIFGITSGWPVYLVFYLIFVGIHMIGVGEALKVIFAITAIAVVALIAFVIGMIPKFDASNLTNIAPTDAAGASDFLPFGYAGILSAFVYGSGSSSRSRGCRSPPRRPGTRRRTCRAGSSPAWASCSCSRRSCSSSRRARAGRTRSRSPTTRCPRRSTPRTAGATSSATSSTTSAWPGSSPRSSRSSSPTRAALRAVAGGLPAPGAVGDDRAQGAGRRAAAAGRRRASCSRRSRRTARA